MEKRKSKKRKLNFRKIYNLTFTLITIFFISLLKIVNILPNKYFFIIMGTSFVVLAITFLFLIKKKKFGYILSLIFIIIYSIITYYLGVTNNFFSSFSKIHYNEETYLIIVLDSSNYKDLKDLNNTRVGYINNNLTSIDKATQKIDNKINVNKEEYEDYNKLFSDLNNSNIESLLIDETYYNIKKEEESVDNYRILDKIKIRSIIKEGAKSVDIAKDPFTIYVSGIDTYGSIETISRSDVNMLITVNPNTKQVLLVSIPRDYYVQLSGTTGYKDKLTHAGNYGINMSINTIEDLLNIDINYYFRVNFSTLEKMIDSIKGVTVYSEYSFVSYIDNYQFYKGYNNMNGKEALAFARERKSLPNGDIDRGKNQEAVIEAIIRKITSKEIIYNYTSILSSLKGTFQTNLTDKDINKFIKKELENLGGWNVTSYSLLGEGQSNYTYSYQGQKLYVMIPDEESVNTGISLINSIINGSVLDGSYSAPSNPKDPYQVPMQEKEKTEDENKNDTNKSDNTAIDNEDNNISKDKSNIDENIKDLLPDEEDKQDIIDNNSSNIESNDSKNEEEVNIP